MSRLVKRLRAPAYWISGSSEGHEGENDLPLKAADEIERLTAALAATERDNTHLRSALAVSKDPCRYCQLPAEEMAKCRSGFPGCDRADDMMGCPELGASLALQEAEVTAWNAAIEAAASAAQGYIKPGWPSVYVYGRDDAATAIRALKKETP